MVFVPKGTVVAAGVPFVKIVGFLLVILARTTYYYNYY